MFPKRRCSLCEKLGTSQKQKFEWRTLQFRLARQARGQWDAGNGLVARGCTLVLHRGKDLSPALCRSHVEFQIHCPPEMRSAWGRPGRIRLTTCTRPLTHRANFFTNMFCAVCTYLKLIHIFRTAARRHVPRWMSCEGGWVFWWDAGRAVY